MDGDENVRGREGSDITEMRTATKRIETRTFEYDFIVNLTNISLRMPRWLSKTDLNLKS